MFIKINKKGINVNNILHCVKDCKGAQRSGIFVGTGRDLSLRKYPTEPLESLTRRMGAIRCAHTEGNAQIEPIYIMTQK